MFKTSVQKQDKKVEAIKTEDEFVKVAENMQKAKETDTSKKVEESKEN
jgi:hypothetical protein